MRLIIHWSWGCSCPHNVNDHTLITLVIMHWTRAWSCTDHVTAHALNIGWSYTDHVTNHTLITLLTTLPPQCISAVFGSIVTSAFLSLIPPPPSSKDPYSVRSTWITQDNLPLSRLILLIPSVESASPGKVTWVTGSGVVMWASLEGCVALPATDIYVTRGNNTCHLLFGGLS